MSDATVLEPDEIVLSRDMLSRDLGPVMTSRIGVQSILDDRLKGVVDRVMLKLADLGPGDWDIGGLIDDELRRVADRVDLDQIKTYLLKVRKVEPALVAKLSVCGRNRQDDYVWARVADTAAPGMRGCDGRLAEGTAIHTIHSDEARF